MTNLNTILLNTRRLALAALLGSSFALVGCGGGGGDDEGEGELEEVFETQFDIESTPDLDGVVFGDNASSQGRTDLAPTVGDGAFIPLVTSGAASFVAFYSFDLPELPEGATIKSATMSVYNHETQGDPKGMMVLVRVDHVNYGENFPQTAFAAQGLDTNFTTIDDINVLGRKELDVTEQVQADVDSGRSRSQYRLRGAIASDLDGIADVAKLTDGEDSAGTGELPMLIIELEE